MNKPDHCPRCDGTHFTQDLEGDWACMICGWVQPPADLLYPKPDVKHREPITHTYRGEL